MEGRTWRIGSRTWRCRKTTTRPSRPIGPGSRSTISCARCWHTRSGQPKTRRGKSGLFAHDVKPSRGSRTRTDPACSVSRTSARRWLSTRSGFGLRCSPGRHYSKLTSASGSASDWTGLDVAVSSISIARHDQLRADVVKIRFTTTDPSSWNGNLRRCQMEPARLSRPQPKPARP